MPGCLHAWVCPCLGVSMPGHVSVNVNFPWTACLRCVLLFLMWAGFPDTGVGVAGIPSTLSPPYQKILKTILHFKKPFTLFVYIMQKIQGELSILN